LRRISGWYFWDRGWQKLILSEIRRKLLLFESKRLSLVLSIHSNRLWTLPIPNVSFSDVLGKPLWKYSFQWSSYALICRYSEDGWYELRVNVSGGSRSYKLWNWFYRKSIL
jgi:hypothetical protein